MITNRTKRRVLNEHPAWSGACPDKAHTNTQTRGLIQGTKRKTGRLLPRINWYMAPDRNSAQLSFRTCTQSCRERAFIRSQGQRKVVALTTLFMALGDIAYDDNARPLRVSYY